MKHDAITAPASRVARVTLMGKQVRETQAGFQRHRVYSISTRRPIRDHRFLNLLGIRAVELGIMKLPPNCVFHSLKYEATEGRTWG